jgi:hypothetical protein
MFTEIEQQTLDIDWFFTDNEEIAFVASGGGKLPKSIAESNTHDLLVSYFRNLPEKSEIVINVGLVKILNVPIEEKYLSDFVLMAKKGMYAFDKTVLDNFSEPNYHLVAKPLQPIKVNDLPPEIFKIISLSKYEKQLKTTLNINSFEIT